MNDGGADGDNELQGQRQDPFAAWWHDEYWYPEPVREKRINLLLHLAPYSTLLLVVGENGSGKTTVLHRFLSQANDTWRICQVQGGADIDRPELLDALEAEFQAQDAPGRNEETRIQRLRDTFQVLRRGSLIPMLVIDDAHLLPKSALALLNQLTRPRDDGEILLGAILFGESALEDRCSASGVDIHGGRISHSFDLPPFDASQTTEYVHHRLQIAGMAMEDAFPPRILKYIHVTSGGLPGRINQTARAVIENHRRTGGKPAPLMQDSARRTLLRYGLAALVLALVISGFLYRDLWIEFPAVDPVAPEVATIDEPTPPEPAPEAAPEAAPAPAPPEIVMLPVLPEPSEAPDSAVESEPATAGAAWLRAQPPEHFTIQLFASSRERIDSLIESQGLDEATAVFRARDGDPPLYAVVYGVWPSRADAAQAAGQPPVSTIEGIEPWIRPVGDIRTLLEEAAE